MAVGRGRMGWRQAHSRAALDGTRFDETSAEKGVPLNHARAI